VLLGPFVTEKRQGEEFLGPGIALNVARSVYAPLMTLDSVTALVLAWSASPLGVGILTGVIVAGVLSLPGLIRWFLRGVVSAPERILMGTLNFIDRRTSAKYQDLL
jgi:hypothetical protein